MINKQYTSNYIKEYNLSNLISENRTYLMGVSIIMIMIFHQYYIPDNKLLNIIAVYGNYGVDIFLFLSAFGIIYSLKKYNTITFYKRRLIRILPACIIAGILKYLITEYASTSITYLSPDAFTNVTYKYYMLLGWDLWFIRSILFLYLLSPLLNYIFNQFNKIIALTVGVIISIFLVYCYSYNDGIINWLCSRFPSFLLGIYVAKNNLSINKPLIILSLLFLFFAIILKYFGFRNLFPELTQLIHINLNYILFAFSLPIVLLTLIKLKNALNFTALNNVIIYIGGLTLEIYLLHEFIYKCIYNYFLNNNFRIEYGLIVAIIISILLSILIKVLCDISKTNKIFK